MFIPGYYEVFSYLAPSNITRTGGFITVSNHQLFERILFATIRYIMNFFFFFFSKINEYYCVAHNLTGTNILPRLHPVIYNRGRNVHVRRRVFRSKPKRTLAYMLMYMIYRNARLLAWPAIEFNNNIKILLCTNTGWFI